MAKAKKTTNGTTAEDTPHVWTREELLEEIAANIRDDNPENPFIGVKEIVKLAETYNVGRFKPVNPTKDDCSCDGFIDLDLLPTKEKPKAKKKAAKK